MFSVRFVTVSVILEANGSTSSFPNNRLLLPGVGWGGVGGHVRETAEETVGVERPSQQLSPAHFSLSPFSVQHSIPCDPRAQLLWGLHLHCGPTAETSSVGLCFPFGGHGRAGDGVV